MTLLAVQLNHPGVQKKHSSNGYIHLGNKVIRKWNTDRSHYRKFILNSGIYLRSKTDTPNKGELLFWGEWEGYSWFTPFGNQLNKHYPNGYHKPFHNITNRGTQNTDPYVFGGKFYYATCRQKGQMCRLDKYSLILFGTPDKKGYFLLDTVFVVDKYEDSAGVKANKAVNYSEIYKDETLDLLDEYLGSGNSLNPEKKLYHSLTWWDSKDFFSFVPIQVKPQENIIGFERLKIPIRLLYPIISMELTQEPRVPVKFLVYNNLSLIHRVWDEIVSYALEHEFYLGIKFDEPSHRILPIKP